MNLEGVTLSVLREFIAGELLNGRIDKVAQPGRLALLLRVRNRQKNFYLYITCQGGAPHMRLTDGQPPGADAPAAFCMLLRKHIENGRITAIEQETLERAIRFDIDVLGVGRNIITKNLIIELTGKSSNIILARDGIIIDCARHIGENLNRFRQMLPGRPYLPPPPQSGGNILTEDARSIAENIAGTQLPLSAAVLKATVGIGPFSAREIIWRSGLPPSMPAPAMDAHDTAALSEAIESIAAPIKEKTAPITVAVKDENLIAAVVPYKPEHLGKITLKSFPDINEAIAFAAELKKIPAAENARLLKFVKNEEARTEKKLALLAEEYKNAANAEDFKNVADNLMERLYLLKKGMERYAFTDTGTGRPIEASLKAGLSPAENAQRYYKLYNKAKRAAGNLEQQTAEGENLLEYLAGVRFSIENAQSADELSEIKNELAAGGLWKEKTAKTAKLPPSSPLKIKLASGACVFVGKNNRQNDLLTFKIARAGDIWLHAKNIPGSHVILQCGGKAADDDDLAAAAHLAAWFSKARASSGVPVDYVARRHVRKPAGGKPGFVLYENQKTLQITANEDFISQLLKQAVN
ncbi:MAG: NFACT family protein [Acidaminococcales bacterium]|jgi:predicted ribosome quality control (RQC) complex YloA/Tae2 family protein|nr:NFACT family protein [Acidaminococcales bacterium]